MLKEPRISIMTATGCYNLGDECILFQEIQHIRGIFEKSRINVFTYDSAGSDILCKKYSHIEYVPYFPSGIRKNPLMNILYFLKNIYSIFSSDLIIIGGGGLFFEGERKSDLQKLLSQWKMRIRLGKLLKKPIFYWSISLEIRNKNNHALLRPLFEGENIKISVRDTSSKQILESLGLHPTLLKDPVLGINRDAIVGDGHKGSMQRKLVGIAFRGGYLYEEEASLIGIIGAIRESGFEPIFISHSIHKEKSEENDYLYFKSLSERTGIAITSDIESSMRTFGEIEFLISMRLHGAVIACSLGIPFILISYGQKTEEFGRLIQYEYHIKSSEFSVANFKVLYHKLLKDGDNIRKYLKSKTAENNSYTQEVRQIFQELLGDFFPQNTMRK